MEISFASRKLKKVFDSDRSLSKEFGAQMVKKIRVQMAILESAESLDRVPNVPPPRRHELSGKRQGQFAVDLKHPHRLIFEPANEPVPRKDDGGIDLAKVTRIKILEVLDYH